MKGPRRSKCAARAWWFPLAALAVLVGFPASEAKAQVVQGCQPDQYLDRTAPGAVRQLTWDFGIVTDPAHCIQIQTGQTVVWVGDFSTHPLGVPGNDTSNPILFHNNGSVTFNAAGTFGYQCNAHAPMIGAIKVVQAPPSVPAVSPWLVITLAALLFASGLIVVRRRQSTMAATRSHDQ
jgi:plastocyanin